MDLREVVVEPAVADDEGRYQRLMQAHHYLGALPKIGETQWYVARWRREWVALIGFSAPALKCRARDAWIGWDFRVQYDRLHLVTDNSRFLILPGWHRPNLASRLLSLCERRLVSDWPIRFGHPLLLLETFVDPSRCRIRTGHGPENTTRLRRFAIGVIRSKSHCVVSAVRRLNRKARLVFDYLKMTENTLHPKKLAPSSRRTNWSCTMPLVASKAHVEYCKRNKFVYLVSESVRHRYCSPDSLVGCNPQGRQHHVDTLPSGSGSNSAGFLDVPCRAGAGAPRSS